jgi:hypothetical protein
MVDEKRGDPMSNRRDYEDDRGRPPSFETRRFIDGDPPPLLDRVRSGAAFFLTPIFWPALRSLGRRLFPPPVEVGLPPVVRESLLWERRATDGSARSNGNGRPRHGQTIGRSTPREWTSPPGDRPVEPGSWEEGRPPVRVGDRVRVSCPFGSTKVGVVTRVPAQTVDDVFDFRPSADPFRIEVVCLSCSWEVVE